MKRASLKVSALASIGAAVATLLGLLISGSLSARALGPTDRGYYALLVLVPSLVGQIGAAGLSLSLAYYVAGGKLTALQAMQTLERAIKWQLAFVVAGALALGVVLNLGHPPNVMVCAVIATSFTVSSLIKDYALAVVQATGKSVLANVLKSLPPLVGAVGVTLYYVLDGQTLLLFVLVWVGTEWLTSGFAGVVAARVALADHRARNAGPPAVGEREMIAYGRAGYFSYLSPLDTFRLDQIYVGLALSPTALGFYAAGSAFTTIPRVMAHSIGLTASPFISRMVGEEPGSGKKAALAFGGVSVVISAGTALVIVIAAPWVVPTLFGEPFRPAIPVTQILMIGAFFFAVRRIVVDILRGMGDAGAGFRPEVAGLIVFAAACPILADAEGIVGVAWAFTIAAFVNVSLLMLSRKDRLLRGLSRRSEEPAGVVDAGR